MGMAGKDNAKRIELDVVVADMMGRADGGSSMKNLLCEGHFILE